MLNPAKRVESIELSQIRKMFEVANPDAISLGLGEPDFDLPENIKMAIKQAVDDNFSHYTSNKGDIELREAIVDKLDKDNSIKATPDDVIVTCGASESLYTCAQALFNKGDDVLIPNPGFLSYAAVVNLAEANPVEVSTPIENGFKLKVDDVQEKLSKNTKALIINSPSNPTGAVIDKEDIKGIADLATDHGFFIIADEIYEKIVYGNNKNYSPAQYSDNIGYLVANENINDEFLKVHQYCTACASSISQRAALEALTGPQDSVKMMVGEFEKRKNLIVSRLNEMGHECPDCGGAFYVFPKVERPHDFVKAAADAGVIAVLGEAFGSLGKENVRMSYATSYENIEKAMDILDGLEY